MKPAKLVLALLLAAVGAGVAAQPAAPYPARPLRLVIGFAPGGAADYVARAMSDAFGKALGQSVVVDNKPGNGSSIAADIVAKAPADGYTVLIASPSSISVNPALNPKLSYAPSDLAPSPSSRLRRWSSRSIRRPASARSPTSSPRRRGSRAGSTIRPRATARRRTSAPRSSPRSPARR